jgi:cob(I)alamin adenosyltransferase
MAATSPTVLPIAGQVPKEHVLAVDSVSYSVGGVPLLANVTLALRTGEVVAAVGPNGAGKTTLLRILSGLLQPSAGTVQLQGKPLESWSSRDRARLIASVPQHTNLDFDVTALDLVLMGRHPHLGRFQLEGRADVAVAEAALAATRASELAHRSVLDMSGGERQRVLIARALAQEPRVLLLDEPTANLDIAHQLQVMDLIHELAAERNVAVLAAIHDLAAAARHTERMLLLARGRVVGEGAPADVLTEERIAAVYGVRASLHVDPRSGALGVTALEPVPESTDAPIEDLSDEGRARKRAEQEEVRAHPERRSKGLVIVNTGNGKGKTTAALGLLLRAWGRDMRIVMLQFIKAKTGKWGEIRAAGKMGVELVPLGDGFTWTSKDIEHDRALAQEGWQQCRERIASGAYDIVILDELTYCLKFGWLEIDEVLDVLRARPDGQHVIITGRDAPADLIEFADLVTEMREVKHPYKAGVRAQPGVEF